MPTLLAALQGYTRFCQDEFKLITTVNNLLSLKLFAYSEWKVRIAEMQSSTGI